MDYRIIVEGVALFLSSFGAAVIMFGGIWAIIKVLSGIGRRTLDYNAVRIDFTSRIMMGLEFFVAGDLINSILSPSLDEVIILGIIVAIRTVVGYSLNQELKQICEKEIGNNR
jgi:uncharacterized membrane protein